MVGPSTIEDIRWFLTENEISTVGEFMKSCETTADLNNDLEKVYRKCMNYPENTVTMGQDDIDI